MIGDVLLCYPAASPFEYSLTLIFIKYTRYSGRDNPGLGREGYGPAESLVT